MDSNAKIKALRQEMRDIKPSTKSAHAGIREAAIAAFERMGREIDAEFLRKSQRAISII